VACRAVDAATLGKLNKHLAGEVPGAKPDKEKSLSEALWLPPNTALQVRTRAGMDVSLVCEPERHGCLYRLGRMQWRSVACLACWGS
jgi:hypothetical protein